MPDPDFGQPPPPGRVSGQARSLGVRRLGGGRGEPDRPQQVMGEDSHRYDLFGWESQHVYAAAVRAAISSQRNSTARARAQRRAARSRSGSVRRSPTRSASSRTAPTGTRYSGGSMTCGPGASYAITGTAAASISSTPYPKLSSRDGNTPTDTPVSSPGNSSGSYRGRMSR